MKRLGVIGAGQMVTFLFLSFFLSCLLPRLLTCHERTQGLGIALVAAQRAQVPVTLVDSSQASLDKGIAFAGW